MPRLSEHAIGVVKVFVFLLALAPLGRLLLGVFAFPEWLGANPAEYITRSTGDWALRFLLMALAVTPLRKVSGWVWIARLRRMLGLYAFFYVIVHFASYVSFDHVFDVRAILEDVVKRPFITVGFLSLLLLLPLAATSTHGMVRRLGAQRWNALHRLVYLIGPLAVLHFWWMVKRDLTEPVIYALVLAALLGYRVREKWRATRREPPSASRQTLQ